MLVKKRLETLEPKTPKFRKKRNNYLVKNFIFFMLTVFICNLLQYTVIYGGSNVRQFFY